MSQIPESQPSSPDESLPPVEPPDAGFIVQLFVVPGVIVLVIVLVWWLVVWFSQTAGDPKADMQALRRSGPQRWQAAMNLAGALSSGRHDDFKQDRESAQELAGILQEDLDAGKTDEGPIRFRYYVCKSLGELHVDDGLPALLQAAATRRTEGEVAVQSAAIESIALLAENVAKHTPDSPLAHADLLPTLSKLADDSEDIVRETTAFALGSLGGERAQQVLRGMLNDRAASVRFNAATGLARHGDPAAVDVLLEMLGPPSGAVIEGMVETPVRRRMSDAERERWVAQRRRLITINAIRAAKLLLSQQTERDDDTVRLVDAIRSLAADSDDRQIQMEAKAAQELLAP